MSYSYSHVARPSYPPLDQNRDHIPILKEVSTPEVHLTIGT